MGNSIFSFGFARVSEVRHIFACFVVVKYVSFLIKCIFVFKSNLLQNYTTSHTLVCFICKLLCMNILRQRVNTQVNLGHNMSEQINIIF